MTDNALPPPTIGEIGRAVIRLAEEFAEFRRDLAKTYVSQELYRSEKATQKINLDVFKTDIVDLRAEVRGVQTQRDADRRLVWTTLLSPLITGIILAVFLHVSKYGTITF